MTPEEKKQICEQCEFYFYNVLPNLWWCSKANNAIDIIVQSQECPIGKW